MFYGVLAPPAIVVKLRLVLYLPVTTYLATHPRDTGFNGFTGLSVMPLRAPRKAFC